jgi:tetraacyldisaccharide 4'-kinase
MTTVMTLEGTTVNSIDDVKSCSIEEFRQYSVHEPLHAAAAIGNPERFFAMLTSLGFEVVRHPFADHHSFRRQDFANIPNNARIIMTEKDAVKCRGLGLENAWYLPVNAILPAEFNDWFCEKVNNVIGNRT